jgi:hypothetical protein
MDFPLMLYKPGSMFEWDGETFDYLIVEDGDEAKAAKADGWSVDKPSAEKKEPESDLSALRAEYKAKHGKAAFNGWDADKLREKLAALG